LVLAPDDVISAEQELPLLDRRDVTNRYEAIAPGIRERAKKRAVYDAEDRDHGTYTQRNCEQRRQRKARLAHEGANRVSSILNSRFDKAREYISAHGYPAQMVARPCSHVTATVG
jgi:K+/H+ antiporter YhaU regulatory subunit KhtT